MQCARRIHVELVSLSVVSSIVRNFATSKRKHEKGIWVNCLSLITYVLCSTRAAVESVPTTTNCPKLKAKFRRVLLSYQITMTCCVPSSWSLCRSLFLSEAEQKLLARCNQLFTEVNANTGNFFVNLCFEQSIDKAEARSLIQALQTVEQRSINNRVARFIEAAVRAECGSGDNFKALT